MISKYFCNKIKIVIFIICYEILSLNCDQIKGISPDDVIAYDDSHDESDDDLYEDPPIILTLVIPILAITLCICVLFCAVFCIFCIFLRMFFIVSPLESNVVIVNPGTHTLPSQSKNQTN